MILQSLYDLYNRLEKEPEYEVAPFGFSLQQVTYCVVITKDGSIKMIDDIRTNDNGRRRPRLLQVPGATKSPGSGMNPGFLWDNSSYMLGYKPKDEKPTRTLNTFRAFRKRHLELEAVIKSARFSAVCRFLEKWDPECSSEFPIIDEVNPGYGVFQLVGETSYVHEDEVVRKWWIGQQCSDAKNALTQCLVSGQLGPVAETHPKVKKVGDQSEALLVSFNAPSFESYSKTQSLNAPVSTDAAFKYATTLNALLAGPMSHRHRFVLGDTTVVFWTERPSPVEDVLAQFFQYGDEVTHQGEAQDATLLRKMRIFMNALRKGREAYGGVADHPDQTKFYMLGLTGQAKGRLGVRFFYRNSVSVLLENLRKHYCDIRVIRSFGEDAKWPDPEFPTIAQILREAVPLKRGKEDPTPPLLIGPLLRSVIQRTPYPDSLFCGTVRRIHVEKDINYIRACIIAGYLRRNAKQEVSMALDEERSDAPYRLGRLFAVLERIQELAYWHQTGGNLERSIRDSYFSAACMTPASVFPRLERLSTHHRRHLPGGSKHHFDQLIANIKEDQNEPPDVLPLRKQAAFILGYYHQWKQLRDKSDHPKEQTNKQEA